MYSIIVPVYNRPDEVAELLESLTQQTDPDFEVVVVEDGSVVSCREIVETYSNRLTVRYFFIPNSGPGQARNYGASQSTGDYLLILDSDCIIPPLYIEKVKEGINHFQADAFGGPDKALDSFTPIQKAINYAMTSFFTTGGIRGGKKKMDKFYPRSFNMGIKKDIFEKLGGFSKMRFGEDIDFSIRIFKEGYRVSLFSDAFVYHKRRTDFKKFFRQVYNSGIARINLYKKYPDSLKLVHCFPSVFTLFLLLSILASPWCLYGLYCVFFYALLIACDAWLKNGNTRENSLIAPLAIAASFVQLVGYGSGFLSGVWNRILLNKGEFSAFEKNFYK